MRKILCIMVSATLLLSSSSVAYAKQNTAAKQNQKSVTVESKKNVKDLSKKSVNDHNKKKEKEEYKKNVKEQKVNVKEQKNNVKEQSKKNETGQDKKSVNNPSVKEKASKKVVKIKEKKQSFKIAGSPVIKYGRYKLPIKPVTKGMGAEVDFDKDTATLTVTKGTINIVIDFKEKTVLVNNIEDTQSGLFTVKNSKKMNVLIKYIANKLGVRVNIKDGNVSTEIPGLNAPTAVTVTPVGTAVVENTLNANTTYLLATANIIAGQATGGKAELYVGSKLVATDSTIEATDTTVTFTTSDESPNNIELQALIPEGGIVTVKLYNAEQKSVISNVANPTLKVDYTVPSYTDVTSAAYVVSGSAITIDVISASQVNDKVDVTKISIVDPIKGMTHQLTGNSETGSVGIVSSSTRFTINLGLSDKLALSKFIGSSVYIKIDKGSLLIDDAGNTSVASIEEKYIPLTIIQ